MRRNGSRVSVTKSAEAPPVGQVTDSSFEGKNPSLEGKRNPDKKKLIRPWPVVRYLVGTGVLAVAVWVLSSHTDELSGITTVFDHLNWWWILGAVAAEALSFVSFTAMEYELLTTRGGVTPPTFPLLKMTFASQALTNSLPAGNAVAAVYGFRWFRRFGADDTLAVWAMVGTFIASMVSLSLVATAGLALATGEGASLDLIPVLIGILVIAVAVGAIFVYERPLLFVVNWTMRASRSILRRSKGDTAEQIDRILGRITSVRLSWRRVVTVVAWGTANWLFDCLCFVLMFLAIGAAIPWKGLLLAYGAGQLAAALPITPGGLGTVEGSITIALVAFGGAHVTTVDAVLLYRLISFWLVLAVGWILAGELALEVRRGRWIRQALASPVEADIEPRRDPDSVEAGSTDGSSVV
jgi:putative heme transporter